MKKIFYIHGGPGLNSAPEEQILSKLFKNKGYSVYFWNEPSSQRSTYGIANELVSTDAMTRYLTALELEFSKFASSEETHIIAFSFGVLGGNFLANRFPDIVSKLVLISPAHEFKATLTNVVKTSAALHHPKAASVLSLLNESRSERAFDLPFANALSLAFENDQILPLYFQNMEAFQETLRAWKKPGFSPDFDSLFSVLRAFDIRSPNELFPQKTKVPTLTVLGKNDLFCPVDLERSRIEALYTKANQYLFLENARHYVHLDRSNEFVDAVGRFI